jgi:hypothetical protein
MLFRHIPIQDSEPRPEAACERKLRQSSQLHFASLSKPIPAISLSCFPIELGSRRIWLKLAFINAGRKVCRLGMHGD